MTSFEAKTCDRYLKNCEIWPFRPPKTKFFGGIFSQVQETMITDPYADFFSITGLLDFILIPKIAQNGPKWPLWAVFGVSIFFGP